MHLNQTINNEIRYLNFYFVYLRLLTVVKKYIHRKNVKLWPQLF